MWRKHFAAICHRVCCQVWLNVLWRVESTPAAFLTRFYEMSLSPPRGRSISDRFIYDKWCYVYVFHAQRESFSRWLFSKHFREVLWFLSSFSKSFSLTCFSQSRRGLFSIVHISARRLQAVYIIFVVMLKDSRQGQVWVVCPSFAYVADCTARSLFSHIPRGAEQRESVPQGSPSFVFSWTSFLFFHRRTYLETQRLNVMPNIFVRKFFGK